MSDTIDDFRALKTFRQKLKREYGRPCPTCREKLPQANSTILLPQQVCRIHGYRDERPELTQADWDAIP